MYDAIHRPLYLTTAPVLLCYILPTAGTCSKSSALPVLHILVVRLCLLLLLQHNADVPCAHLARQDLHFARYKAVSGLKLAKVVHQSQSKGGDFVHDTVPGHCPVPFPTLLPQGKPQMPLFSHFPSNEICHIVL